ncbi:MAG: ParB/RepB/Spo0J family partition protein [Clostridia bacterium]|nr:ParB/RepB/Spo0J family partition protein [Clostridia bacterium]
MAKNKGLGRGLDAIFYDNSIEENEKNDKGIASIRISMIEPKKDQPRRNFDREALASLADSIAANGVLQPIIVREGVAGMYSIIAGERRWRASKLAGLSEIPAIVVDADEFAAAKIAMIENLQREDLNPMEEALGYRDLMENYSLTQEALSTHIGKSRSAIANSLRLLDLPDEVLELIASGELSAGHGRALLGLRDKAQIAPLAEKIIARNLSVREAEAAVKAQNKKLTALPEEPAVPAVNYIADLESRVESSLGRRCKITNTPKKKMIQLEFTDNDDLQALLYTLCGKDNIDD